MKRAGQVIAVAAALAAAGCSKDRADGGGEAQVDEKVSGVGVVSANELGPQKRFVPVTTQSNDARAVFERGRDLAENIRQAEAADKFRKAIELDPKFALAHGYLGFVTSERDAALEHFDRALELAERLPESERLVIEGMKARKLGDREAEGEIYRKLTELAPKDWRVAMWMGESANRLGDPEGAIEAFERARELNPQAAAPNNTLAYVYAYRNEWDEAIEVAERYAELKPSEPNPRDSLGEILMMAGRFDEAEASFRKAIEIAPTFNIAWEGVAMTHVYREQWDDAIDAWERAIAGERRVVPKFQMELQRVWTYMAAGRTKKALAQLDAMAKAADESGRRDLALRARLTRAQVLEAAGNRRAATRQIDGVLDSLDRDEQGGAVLAALAERVWVEVEAGETTRAKATLEKMEAIGGAAYDGKDALRFARGLVALATGDAAGAVENLEKLAGTDKMEGRYLLRARWALARALEKRGDDEPARQLRAATAEAYRRDAYHAFQRRDRFGAGS